MKLNSSSALIFAVFSLFCAGRLSAQNSIFTGHSAAGAFASGEVSQAKLTAVLEAGIHAPSAMNRQPWHFTVVRDPALAREIITGITGGNVVIVVSAPDDLIKNGRGILDCGLAVESMYLAAQSSGLASRIYTGPIDGVNRSLKSRLGLPSGHSAVALVRVGLLPPDAVSSPSSRQKQDSKVTWK